MRTPAAVAALILAGSALSACGGNSTGGNSTGAYCSTLKADKAAFSNAGTSPGAVEKAFKAFHQLAAKAPDAVASDWKVVDKAVSTIEKDLKDAGVTFDQLAKAQTSGQLPSGVDQTKLKKAVTDIQSLSGGKFKKATDAIEKHAKKQCKVNLGSSS